MVIVYAWIFQGARKGKYFSVLLESLNQNCKENIIERQY